jgi:demethylmenaquinone methyltransferase / 2-methoxy-6-polyprenyl-1,4-benzoquinol methylase
MTDPVRVRSMFARIAKSYDLLNAVLSLGIDRRWRKALLARAGDVEGRTIVDSCCGTGDVAVVFARAGARVVGVDFTPEMLARAAHKGEKPRKKPVFVHGDALSLPVASGIADACTVAFGIRNVADRRACLREMSRVVRPGGQVLVLEFTMPPGAVLQSLYRFYFTRVLPTIGRLVSKDGDAYSYLPRTVLAWPSPGEFQREMEEEGLVECGHSLLTRGIACIHWGRTTSNAPPTVRDALRATESAPVAAPASLAKVRAT